jgi:hypothetical protein
MPIQGESEESYRRRQTCPPAEHNEALESKRGAHACAWWCSEAKLRPRRCSDVENVSSSRRSRKPRKLLLFPVRTPSAFLRAFWLPEAEMLAPAAEASRKSPQFCKILERRKKREKDEGQRTKTSAPKSRVLGLREHL